MLFICLLTFALNDDKRQKSGSNCWGVPFDTRKLPAVRKSVAYVVIETNLGTLSSFSPKVGFFIFIYTCYYTYVVAFGKKDQVIVWPLLLTSLMRVGYQGINWGNFFFNTTMNVVLWKALSRFIESLSWNTTKGTRYYILGPLLYLLTTNTLYI